MSGHKPWSELRDKMPPESRARAEAMAEKMRDEIDCNALARDACRAVLHWYECDSSEYNRELAVKACRDAVEWFDKLSSPSAERAPR